MPGLSGPLLRVVLGECIACVGDLLGTERPNRIRYCLSKKTCRLDDEASFPDLEQRVGATYAARGAGGR